jgi:hypothetical protein
VYELIHLEPGRRECDGTSRIGFNQLRRQVARLADEFCDLPCEDVNATGATGSGPYRRLLQDSRSLYRSDALDRLLPLGRIEPRALPGETYSLALTAGLIAGIFQSKLPRSQPVLYNGGYRNLDGDGHWWIPSGRVFFSPQSSDSPAQELEYAQRHFFLPHRYLDAFGNVAQVAYDSHDLVPVETRDAVGNVVQAQLDYRVMQPRTVTDANGNRAEAAFNAMGMLAGTAGWAIPWRASLPICPSRLFSNIFAIRWRTPRQFSATQPPAWSTICSPLTGPGGKPDRNQRLSIA